MTIVQGVHLLTLNCEDSWPAIPLLARVHLTQTSFLGDRREEAPTTLSSLCTAPLPRLALQRVAIPGGREVCYSGSRSSVPVYQECDAAKSQRGDNQTN